MTASYQNSKLPSLLPWASLIALALCSLVAILSQYTYPTAPALPDSLRAKLQREDIHRLYSAPSAKARAQLQYAIEPDGHSDKPIVHLLHANSPADAPLLRLPSHPNPPDLNARFAAPTNHGPWLLYMPRQTNASASKNKRKAGPDLRKATVALLPAKGAARPCRTQKPGQFRCGPASWMRVEARSLTIDKQRRRCIWAHPQKDARLLVRMPPSQQPLILETALDDDAVANGRRDPVQIELRYGDLHKTITHPDRRGIRTHKLPAPDQPATLKLEIFAKNTGRRHFCFSLQADTP